MPEATKPTQHNPHSISSEPLSPKPAQKPAPPPSPPPAPSKTPPPPPSEPAQSSDNAPEYSDESSKAEGEPDAGIVDMETFRQILELDDEDDPSREFSRGMAWAFFSQAEQTFKEMDEALAGKDLAQLSSLGHFLKGSSAALGLSKVQASCEKIQHYGQHRDEATGKDITASDALQRIEALLLQVNKEYTAAESWLKEWYEKNSEPGPDAEAEHS